MRFARLVGLDSRQRRRPQQPAKSRSFGVALRSKAVPEGAKRPLEEAKPTKGKKAGKFGRPARKAGGIGPSRRGCNPRPCWFLGIRVGACNAPKSRARQAHRNACVKHIYASVPCVSSRRSLAPPSSRTPPP